MDIANKIHMKLEKILNRLKILNIIETFKLEIKFCNIEENVKINLVEIDTVLKKCLRKILARPKKAEIRNVIGELVRKKNLNNVKKVHLAEEIFSSFSKDSTEGEELKSQETKIGCGICKEYFDSSKNLCVHLHAPTKVKNYLCEFCGKIFKNIISWNSHSSKECCIEKKIPKTGKLKLQCINNDKSKSCQNIVSSVQSTENLTGCDFQTQTVLKNDGVLTESPTPRDNSKNIGFSQVRPSFVCKCGKNFRLLKTLKKHKILKHSSEGEIHSCSICNKFFREKGKLNRHLLSHKEGQYRCTLCAKSFARSDALKRHVSVTHYPQKNFGCTFCRKKFKLKFNRDVHEENVHKKTIDWIECEKCGKKFRNKITFKSHLKLHSDNRITCSFCRKTFNRKIHYRNHIAKKHNGISPYQSLLDSVMADDVF